MVVKLTPAALCSCHSSFTDDPAATLAGVAVKDTSVGPAVTSLPPVTTNVPAEFKSSELPALSWACSSTV